jgi:hypothetical protein
MLRHMLILWQWESKMNNMTKEQLLGEIAAIWARLYEDRIDDATAMAEMLTTEEQRQEALKEMYGEDTNKFN